MPHKDPAIAKAYKKAYYEKIKSDPDRLDEKRRKARERYAKSAEVREASRKRTKRWQKANPDKVKTITRKHILRREYGITPEQYASLLAAQNGGCAICTSPVGSKNQVLHVDHDHQTGVVRGLLCSSCNRALGYFKDSTELLLRAIEYLRRADLRRIAYADSPVIESA